MIRMSSSGIPVVTDISPIIRLINAPFLRLFIKIAVVIHMLKNDIKEETLKALSRRDNP
jgi:hypothetical protein